ncbi:MAG: extracellular solute-binding protein [Pseudomonadota bacterium]
MTSANGKAVIGRLIAAGAAAVAALGACGGEGAGESAGESGVGATAPGVVNLYSGRHYDTDYVLFDQFTEETGVKVNVIEAGGDALIERLAREGANSPADLFITADAGVLWRGEQRDVFQKMAAPAASARVPSYFRHPDDLWLGVTSRARVVIYNKDAGRPEGLETYADLADPAYEGEICIRPSTNVYNQSLLASIIANDGEAAARDWAAGVKQNFARKPQGNDTAQIEAVAAGVCRLAVVNSYYVARYVDSADPATAAIGARVGVIFPNQSDRGAHVNISGVALAAHAPHPENARRFVEFLLRDDVQAKLARSNNEYPVVAGVAADGPVASLGVFKADDLPVSQLGENQAQAVRIFDAVDWP